MADAEAVVLPLKHPVTVGPNTISELVFPARLKGKHLRQYASNEQGRIDVGVCLRVAADACGQPLFVLEDLDGEDVAAVVRVMTGFFVVAGLVLVGPEP